MRMSVGVGPFRFYSGHSRKLPPPSPAFGRVLFFCAILIGVGDGIYALIARGFASAVATFFFMLVIGLVCLVKTANNLGEDDRDTRGPFLSLDSGEFGGVLLGVAECAV